MHSQWQSPPPKNQQPQLQPPPQTTTTITRSSNKFQIQKPQPKKKKKKTQNLQQNPNPTDQSTTKLNNYQRQKLWRMMSKDRRLPLGEQSFRSASRGSDWRASIGELYFRSGLPSSS